MAQSILTVVLIGRVNVNISHGTLYLRRNNSDVRLQCIRLVELEFIYYYNSQ